MHIVMNLFKFLNVMVCFLLDEQNVAFHAGMRLSSSQQNGKDRVDFEHYKSAVAMALAAATAMTVSKAAKKLKAGAGAGGARHKTAGAVNSSEAQGEVPKKTKESTFDHAAGTQELKSGKVQNSVRKQHDNKASVVGESEGQKKRVPSRETQARARAQFNSLDHDKDGWITEQDILVSSFSSAIGLRSQWANGQMGQYAKERTNGLTDE
jgi:hypothetical protein